MPILHVVTGGAHTTNSSTSSRVWSEKEIFWLQDVIARDYVAMYLEVRVQYLYGHLPLQRGAKIN